MSNQKEMEKGFEEVMDTLAQGIIQQMMDEVVVKNPDHVDLSDKDSDKVVYRLKEHPSRETKIEELCTQHVMLLENPFTMIMGIPPLAFCDCYETCEHKLTDKCFLNGLELYDREVGFDGYVK